MGAMMSELERKRLLEELSDLDAAERRLREARKPFDDAIAAIDQVREGLLERHDVEIAGKCESCDRLLFFGDRGCHCDDGPTLCEEHAPTYADLKEQLDAVAPEDRDDEHRQRVESIEAHLAAGGSLDDKLAYEL